MQPEQKKSQKKQNIMCVRKKKKASNPKKRSSLPPMKPVVCKPIEKPPKQPKSLDEPICHQSKFYRSPAETRAYLEAEVVPILMEGMLGLAREQPNDPITYLYKFWKQDQHKCDIQLNDNLL
ncbi:hypothetical protein KR222_001675 [Zaprionus bogoriensis]|nr:hypothetical protein KR222_001675 [Zaprionus bogoriensis]